MASQIGMESCSLCLRNVSERRHLKGNICLKYSGSSTSEVVAYITGQEIPIVLLCFRCYRLLLGIDYHQHEFKRLKNSIVKIYHDRSASVEKSSKTDDNKALLESPSKASSSEKKLTVHIPLPTKSDLSIIPLSKSTEKEISTSALKDSESITSDKITTKPAITSKKATLAFRDKLFKQPLNPKQKGSVVCKSDVSLAHGNLQRKTSEGNYIIKVRSITLRKSKRRKTTKKLKDFEYYADEPKYITENIRLYNNKIMKKNTGEEKMYCGVCQKDFNVKIDYLNHACMQTVDKCASLKCKGCQTSFSVRQHYIKHINKCYKNMPVKCHICLVELQSAAYLPRHLQAFHNGEAPTQKSSLCDLCGRTFSRKEAVQRHQAKVHGIPHGIHQCAKCGQTFLHTSLLMEHLRAHKGYPCPDCKRVFSCMSNLKLHKQTFHQNKTLYVCSLCNKRWRFHASYTNHMRKVHGRAQFNCLRCKLLFSAENAFEKHKEICSENVTKASGNNSTSRKNTSVKTKKSSLTEPDSSKNESLKSNLINDSKANLSHENRFVRLKKVVRKVGSPSQEQIVLPSKGVVCIANKPDSIIREEEVIVSEDNFENSYSESIVEEDITVMSSTSLENDEVLEQESYLSPSNEIILETIEELSSDCQYIILEEDEEGLIDL